MPQQDRRKLQDLYPKPKPRSGMDAKKPTDFRVPIFKLSILLYLPIFLTVAIYSIPRYANYGDWNTYAPGMIGMFCFILLAILASIVMLLKAREIVVRNCNRSWIVGIFYLFIVVPFACVLLYHVQAWFGGNFLWRLFIAEAIILYAASLITTLIARYLSR